MLVSQVVAEFVGTVVCDVVLFSMLSFFVTFASLKACKLARGEKVVQRKCPLSYWSFVPLAFGLVASFLPRQDDDTDLVSLVKEKLDELKKSFKKEKDVVDLSPYINVWLEGSKEEDKTKKQPITVEAPTETTPPKTEEQSTKEQDNKIDLGFVLKELFGAFKTKSTSVEEKKGTEDDLAPIIKDVFDAFAKDKVEVSTTTVTNSGSDDMKIEVE